MGKQEIGSRWAWTSGEGSKGGAGQWGFNPPSHTWAPVKAAPSGAFLKKVVDSGGGRLTVASEEDDSHRGRRR